MYRFDCLYNLQVLENLAASTYGKDLQLFYWGYPPCVHTAYFIEFMNIMTSRKYSDAEQKKKNAFGEKVSIYLFVLFYRFSITVLLV